MTCKKGEGDIILTPYSETPTGEVTVTLRNGETQTMYVADITETEKEMKELFPGFEEEAVKRENPIIVYGLPILLTVVAVMVIMAMMNSQNAGRCRRRPDDEFRQEQSKDGSSGADKHHL